MSPMLFMVTGGTFGIIGLGMTLIQYTFQNVHLISVRVLKLFTLFGLLALLSFGIPMLGSGSDWFWFTLILPLLATTHIYWVALKNT
ncbi:hypothetical protein M3P05_12225 [Sansalvadorimonas sp. 2012CJ34-2]|uniref:Uncharacterized protein n=1 Tax=Parendozoicomonas callyspongiae TaxID=2942213 RepID=A0ABT0PH39_9GAMM|nr:hypothetical protein [Sansalvadorimonas sp. 2012CJ34-2]MCL6270693.1 hypothetical protein [Sansalvadorimonas sp. 2012CJ34-2]